MAASSKSTPAPTQELLDPAKLHFDRENPRFAQHSYTLDEEIVRELYDQADVDELLQSILTGGYIDFEPLVVLREGSIVLEGNRRLAALRLISDEKLRRKLKITLPKIESPKPLPEQVRALVVEKREQARSFIGFKHINGPFKWDALAKAKYAAQWCEQGGSIDEISRTLGDNHNTVRRLVHGYFVLQQAQKEGFDISQITKRRFAFSHLYTALSRAPVREFLGLTPEDLSNPTKKTPIAKENLGQLRQLMSWLYGQNQFGEKSIIHSQNPNLNELSKVLSSPEAKAMLIAQRDLRVAYERVDPPSTRFEEALLKASKQCEELLGVSGFYNGNSTLMEIANGLEGTVGSLVVGMRARAEKVGSANQQKA